MAGSRPAAPGDASPAPEHAQQSDTATASSARARRLGPTMPAYIDGQPRCRALELVLDRNGEQLQQAAHDPAPAPVSIRHAAGQREVLREGLVEAPGDGPIVD